jgi:hypothetical protein
MAKRKVIDREATTMELPVTSNICVDCKREIAVTDGQGGTGYGVSEQGDRVCYSCCGYRDKGDMILEGKAVLFWHAGELTNWPGTLRFGRVTTRVARAGFTGRRLYLTFIGPDGYVWIGNRNADGWDEIVRVKRSSRKSLLTLGLHQTRGQVTLAG